MVGFGVWGGGRFWWGGKGLSCRGGKRAIRRARGEKGSGFFDRGGRGATLESGLDR